MADRPAGKPLAQREAAATWNALPPRSEWVTAADFKARCLRLIEEVRQGQREVVVTRYGKPVARLVPFTEEPMSIFGYMDGTLVFCDDIVSPTGEEWDADA
jgi:prevent-host-death family protein